MRFSICVDNKQLLTDGTCPQGGATWIYECRHHPPGVPSARRRRHRRRRRLVRAYPVTCTSRLGPRLATTIAVPRNLSHGADLDQVLNGPCPSSDATARSTLMPSCCKKLTCHGRWTAPTRSSPVYERRYDT